MDLTEIDGNTASNLKAIQQLCSTNEQLEDERSSILQTTSIDPLFRELLSVTKDVHVGWLLSFPGKQICGKLSRLLDYREPGWQDLANKLQISLDCIMDINLNRYLPEGPTYTILWIYALKDDATIGKVVEKLLEMKRYDILSFLEESVIGETGLIEILRTDAERSSINDQIFNARNSLSNKPHSLSIKPKLPPLPKKYEVFDTPAVIKMRNFSENISERPIFTEGLVTRDITQSEENHIIAKIPSKRTRYKAIVMLTFSVDGFCCAKNIAAVLRKKHIGVLILDEHRNRLVSNPELFITEFFPQVNYVIPIVTKDYLDALTAVSLNESPLTSCTDAHYVKLIYTLMVNQYIKNGCINLKVRCIIPDGNEGLMQKHPVVCNRPLLQAWLPEREVHVLADSILSTSGPRSEE